MFKLNDKEVVEIKRNTNWIDIHGLDLVTKNPLLA
jgi:hypothetical protein